MTAEERLDSMRIEPTLMFEERSYAHPLTSPDAELETGEMGLNGAVQCDAAMYQTKSVGYRLQRGWNILLGQID